MARNEKKSEEMMPCYCSVLTDTVVRVSFEFVTSQMQERQCALRTRHIVCFSVGFIDYWFLANDTARICHASLVNSFIFVSYTHFFYFSDSFVFGFFVVVV